MKFTVLPSEYNGPVDEYGTHPELTALVWLNQEQNRWSGAVAWQPIVFDSYKDAELAIRHIRAQFDGVDAPHNEDGTLMYGVSTSLYAKDGSRIVQPKGAIEFTPPRGNVTLKFRVRPRRFNVSTARKVQETPGVLLAR